ncbi:MAG: AraC family transcriptional regulator, partial [Niallia sp.]
PFSSIYNAETILEVVAVMTSFFDHIVQLIKKHNRFGNPNVIEEAKQWIRDHIYEDISLNKIANYVHMSPNYFSALFKQATGETFMEFSTRTRFELAKQLLIQPEMKIYQIAEKIGYSDANYFSIAFKKSEGMTPSQYRARYL